MADDSFIKQLATLKGFTARTGVLHSAQVLQLECWGHIVLDDISKPWKCYYNVHRQEHPTDQGTPMGSFTDGVVLYVLSHHVAFSPEQVESLKTMETWVQELLGKTWKLHIEDPDGLRMF